MLGRYSNAYGPFLLHTLTPSTPKMIATMTAIPGRTTPIAMVEGLLKPPSLPLPREACEGEGEGEGGDEDEEDDKDEDEDEDEEEDGG